MLTRAFAVVCDAVYVTGLRALVNSIWTYHRRDIPVFLYHRGLTDAQVVELQEHPADIRLWNLSELSQPSAGMWEAKQQVFAHCIGRARCVYLLDADLVLVSTVDDIFALAESGKIVSSSDGHHSTYDESYAAYDPRLPGKRQPYINTGALCLDVVRHWDLAGLWAFASNYGAYSPGAGAPLGLPGHGDQGVFNAIAGMLDKASRYHVLPEGTWCDCTQGCTMRIRNAMPSGALEVWNETVNERQRLVHSSGPKWWTDDGARHLRQFGDKLECFQHFADRMAPHTAQPANQQQRTSASERDDAPSILIGICSCNRYAERRQVVRETWANGMPPGVSAVFFVGDGGASDEDGLVRLPVRDDYAGLPSKVQSFYRYALAHYEFDYLFKCDDDTYVHVERLRTLPRPHVDFLGSEQLDQHGFASGGAGYLMSRAMVQRFADDAVSACGQEDVVFSVRARAGGARMESTPRLQPFGDKVPEAGNDIITGHWCGPFEMRRIHAEFTGGPPGPLLLDLHAVHPAWSGSVRLYADGSFCSRGGAAPNGMWSSADDGESLVLKWFHWPTDVLRLRSWGFEGAVFRLEFTSDVTVSAAKDLLLLQRPTADPSLRSG